MYRFCGIFALILSCLSPVQLKDLRDSDLPDVEIIYPKPWEKFSRHVHSDTLVDRENSTVAPATTAAAHGSIKLHRPATEKVLLKVGMSTTTAPPQIATTADSQATINSTQEAPRFSTATEQSTSTTLASTESSTEITTVLPVADQTTPRVLDGRKQQRKRKTQEPDNLLTSTTPSTTSQDSGLSTDFSIESTTGLITSAQPESTTVSSSTSLSNTTDVALGLGLTWTLPPFTGTSGTEIPAVPGTSSKESEYKERSSTEATSTSSTTSSVPEPARLPAEPAPATGQTLHAATNPEDGYTLELVQPVQPNTASAGHHTMPHTTGAKMFGHSPYAGSALVYPGGATSAATGNNVGPASAVGSGPGKPYSFGSFPYSRPFHGVSPHDTRPAPGKMPSVIIVKAPLRDPYKNMFRYQ